MCLSSVICLGIVVDTATRKQRENKEREEWTTMRKKEYKEVLKDVPEIDEQERFNLKKTILQEKGVVPMKKISDLTPEERAKLEQDIEETEQEIERNIAAGLYNDGGVMAKTFLNVLKKQLEE